jgi:uncharacterized iron-regulated membrane protein
LKKAINKIHLILGLIIGFVIVIVSLTGCIYAFQEEIQNLTQSYRFVEKQQQSFLPPSQLQEIATKALPGKKANRIHYGKKDQAAVVGFYGSNPDYYFLVYLNPYTGKVLQVKDMHSDFFRFILDGHFYLWLPPAIGKPTVSIATLIFVLMIITGIVLWWPKNKAAAKQRFSIKWDAKWRRKNYDLHNVLGFYSSWILIFIAVTGLVWGFEWFSKSFYKITSGGKAMIEWSPATSDTTKVNPRASKANMDLMWVRTVEANPMVESIEVDFPHDKQSAIGITTNTDAGTYWKADNRFYDQYTLKEIQVKHPYGRFDSKLSTADKIRRLNYDVHVGAVLGLPGKLLAFFASLICASLPITGFMIWYGRRYKNKTKAAVSPEFIKYIEFEGIRVEETLEVPGPKEKKKVRLRKKKITK